MVFIQSLGAFLSSWKFVLLFYVIVAIIVYIYRKKFQVEGGFILLYRTNFGIKFIDRVAEKHKEFLKIVGYSAIGIGFAGMIAISILLVKGVYEMIFVPAAAPTLSLVIPGVQIPGSPIFVPFWYGIIALFVVIVVHEFGHGIIAKSHGLKIKNTGFGFMGPLPLAFVEPDEKQVVKKDSVVQQSIFAAGPFFNVILFGIVLVFTLFIFNPLLISMVNPEGVSFGSIQANYPAEKYGLEKNVVYTSVDGLQVNDSTQLVTALSCVKPGASVTIANENKSVTLVTVPNPKDETKGYLGVSSISTNYVIKNQDWWYKGLYYFLYSFTTLLEWIASSRTFASSA